MEETEVPLEQVQEQTEHATHAHSTGGAGWVTWAALLSALLAVLAAVSALYSGSHVNEAMIAQMKASDQWGYYQAKGIKSSILEARADFISTVGKTPSAEMKDKIDKYAEDQVAVQEKAEKLQKESEMQFRQHETFARAVTFFQIAIAITAIAVIARRRKFLFVSGVFGLIGIFYLISGATFEYFTK